MLARRLNKPFALAFAVGIGALGYARRGGLRRALKASDETVKLGTELGFRFFNALGKINRAWVRAQMGETERTADQIPEGLAEFDAQKFYLARAWNLGLLCEAQALAGAVDEALVTVEQALQTNSDELPLPPPITPAARRTEAQK